VSRYVAECIEQCDKGGGGVITPGEFIIDPDAYLLCMPGYRNAAPRFKPADEATAAKVAEETAKKQPVVDQTKIYLQKELDKLAGSGRLELDPATGFFKRDPDGVLLGKLTALEMHVLETADGYGLKPAAAL
jgi:hypothetical protein